jgi:hypothetical protein
MTETEARELLKPGVIIRFRPSIHRKLRLTVKLDRVFSIDTGTSQQGNARTYAIVAGLRVRPDTHASFGLRKVYCINIGHAEIVKGA